MCTKISNSHRAIRLGLGLGLGLGLPLLLALVGLICCCALCPPWEQQQIEITPQVAPIPFPFINPQSDRDFMNGFPYDGMSPIILVPSEGLIMGPRTNTKQPSVILGSRTTF